MRHSTVVIVTDRVLFPAVAGNQARIIELIRLLRADGMKVVLVGPPRLGGHTWKKPGLRSAFRTWRLVDGVICVNRRPFHSGSPFAFDVSPYRVALRRAVARYRPAAVIAEYIWMAPCLDVVPRPAVRLVDTHDVMHVRRAMYKAEPGGAWVDCTPEDEARLLRYADAIIAIQPDEARQLARLAPDRAVICVPHPVPVVSAPSRAATDVVMFVGSPAPGNVVGLRSFVTEAWPIVRAARPEASLLVYGDVANCLDVEPPGVRRVGRVRDLAAAYASATVLVNPVRLGTGLKIKSVEALAHAKALVTTPCGASGIEDGGAVAFVVEDEMRRFGRAVADLLGDERRRRALELEALRFAATHFSRESALRELRPYLATADNPEPLPSVAAAGRSAVR